MSNENSTTEGPVDADDVDTKPELVFEGDLPPGELEVDGENPNEMTEEQFSLLCKRMRQNGWLGGDIITNADGLIADGEHRWRAAQEIGREEVPVEQYEIDEPTRRLWRQELNKIHGEHDTKRDALEYDYLLHEGKSDEVTELTDAADEDLDELLAELRMESDTSLQYEYDPDHSVHFEDATQGIPDRLEDDSIDCVVTDPPYGVDWDTNSRDKENDLPGTIMGDADTGEALDLWQAVATELKRVLKPSGHLYCFADWRTEHAFRQVLDSLGFDIRNVLVWDKTSMGLGGVDSVNYRTQYELVIFATQDRPRQLESRGPDVIQHPRADTSEMSHPTEKPVGLLAKLLTNSTREGDHVLDPFMGSGTTAVAAIQNDRDYTGFEIDAENYKPVIERRIGEAKRQRDATVNQPEATGDD